MYRFCSKISFSIIKLYINANFTILHHIYHVSKCAHAVKGSVEVEVLFLLHWAVNCWSWSFCMSPSQASNLHLWIYHPHSRPETVKHTQAQITDMQTLTTWRKTQKDIQENHIWQSMAHIIMPRNRLIWIYLLSSLEHMHWKKKK